MKTTTVSVTGFSDSKTHFKILDALRGVAALMVVLFHVFETFTGGDHTRQFINHGYLAVDFFFLLSGFVIGYAYDDRWNKMSLAGFFKRRLIRLHPMIIIAMIIGAVTFYFQDCAYFNKISEVPVWKVILVMLIGFTLLPVPPSLEIRGWGEMHPLNGPAWSLFFEYIANLLYALFIRKFSKTVLFIVVLMAAVALIQLAVTSPNGDIIGGWSVDPAQLRIGFTRLFYPFFAGLFVSRVAKPGRVKNAFLWCSLLLILVLSFPRVGSVHQLWINGLYDSLSIILLFPLIIYLGASGEIKGELISKTGKFLGDISYPIYIIHYPFIYIFTAWYANHKTFLDSASPNAIISLILAAFLVLAVSIAVAYACVKFYDIPVRKWLTQRFMSHEKT